MWLKKQIPNAITLLNLLCGSIAVIFAVQDNLIIAGALVVLGIFFDFFDGFAARMLKVQSAIGLQLDSLADMVTSGLVPGVIMVQLLAKKFGNPFLTEQTDWGTSEKFIHIDSSCIVLLGLLITLASGYRLAKFNVDPRQTSSFIGLPTPANALCVISFPLILEFQNEPWITSIILSNWFLISYTLLSCYMLNAEIALFSLKFKNWGIKENIMKYIFLLVSVVLICTLKFIGIPFIIILYIVLSLIFQNTSKGQG